MIDRQRPRDRMKIRDLVLYLISRCQDRPEFGRTSLQKVAYFAALALSRDLGHRAYYYGPFSEVVERELETLVLSELVEERVRSLGFSTRSGFGVKKYEYAVTREAERRVEDIAKIHPDETRILDQLLTLLREYAGRLDQRILSPAAKVLFIAHQEGRPVSPEEIKAAGDDLGWDLDEEQVSAVMELLEKLGFIEIVE